MPFTIPDFGMRWRVPMIRFASGSQIFEIKKFESQDEAIRFQTEYNTHQKDHLRAGEPYYD